MTTDNTKITQCDMILSYMRENGGITPIEAMQEFGCMRLASRICDLKRTHKIKTETVQHSNSYGKTVSYARYSLDDPEFTEKEVREMSPNQVRKNYNGILQSMPKW